MLLDELFPLMGLEMIGDFNKRGNGSILLNPEIVKAEDNVTIAYTVPGYSEKDITVSVEDGDLVISGNREDEIFGKSNFFNRYQLGSKFITEDISTDLSKGILKVVIPRSKPTKRVLKVSTN
jgi:HSP20 family molecular chaperone IbpA